MNQISKKVISLQLLFLIIPFVFSSCASSRQGNPEPVSREEYFLDTLCTVTVYRMKDADGSVKSAADMSDDAGKIIDEAFELCEELENKLSRTRTDSDISRVNKAGGRWTEVSDDTMKVVKLGIKYSELSDGDFDISVGGVTKLWDFHADEAHATLPEKSKLEEAVKHVGYNNIEINGNMLRLSDPKTELDLGGIAKGYIGDRMTEVLEEGGAVSATVNLGGNVICIGGRTDEDDFVIGVEAPFSDRSEVIGKIDARDKTLVTSGIYERMIEVDGKSYHHILDTDTGYPAETDLDAVTLTAGKGRSADIDALSTICLIKGSKEGMKLIESLDGIEGVFVLSDGSVIQTVGAGFEE